MPSAATSQDNPVSLEGVRARRFLTDMKDHPFLAIVMYGDEVRVFTKDIEPEHLEQMRDAFSQALAERIKDADS